MKVYIDSSGDEGFKLGSKRGEGSSQYYITVGLVFHDPDLAIRRIQRLHDMLGLAEDTEFKFHASKKEQRYAFFGMIGTCDFDVFVLTVLKDDITSDRLKNQGVDFRREFCMHLLRRMLPFSNIEAVIDDMESTEEQRSDCKRYLMREVNRYEPSKLASVALVESHGVRLIQAADMCAGAIRVAYEKSDHAFKKLISDKIKNEWPFQ